MAFPNGISARKTTNNEKIEILVVYCYEMGVGVYNIGPAGELIFIKTIRAPAAMDNMWISPEGEVYLSGHPLAWKFMLSMWNPNFGKTFPPGNSLK